MPLFANPFTTPGATPGGFKPALRIDAKNGKLLAIDPGGSSGDRSQYEIPIGSRMIIDHGCIFAGAVKFSPKFAELLVPLGAPEPQLPPGEDLVDWQTAVRLQSYVD